MLSGRPLDSTLRERIALNLDNHERLARADEALQPAAVAVALVANELGEACFVITRRVHSLRNHSGQWALPGGRIDEGEGTVDAALRELHEEVGLLCGPSSVLGLLDDYPTRSGFLITPVVVWVGPDAAPVPNPDEVAEVHLVRLIDLEGPGIPTLREIDQSDRPVLSVAILEDEIFAPTAAFIYQLREVGVYGRSTRVAHYEQPVFAWK